VAEVEIILSDGQPCVIRRLGLFDLDGVGPELAGPYTYTWVLANGEEIQSVYDIRDISIPPVPPDKPENEIIEGSPLWNALVEWQTYKAAVAHEIQVRQPSEAEYVLAISRFIVDRCVKLTDHERIQTEEDWDAVYEAAVVPQITVDMLAQTFIDTFSASFAGEEVFDAIKKAIKGVGSYDSIRLWEHEAMSKYSYGTEEMWADLSLPERARKTASVALPQLMKTLEADRQHKEAQKQQARAKK
jgi:hypothetical protein